jgi:hypothetical protein
VAKRQAILLDPPRQRRLADFKYRGNRRFFQPNRPEELEAFSESVASFPMNLSDIVTQDRRDSNAPVALSFVDARRNQKIHTRVLRGVKRSDLTIPSSIAEQAFPSLLETVEDYIFDSLVRENARA